MLASASRSVYVLRVPVAVMHKSIGALWLPGVERLFQSVEHEEGMTHLPDDDVDDEDYVEPPLPGRPTREARDPELDGAIRFELPMYPIQRTGRRRVRHRDADDFATPDTLQSQAAHQPLDGAVRPHNALAVHRTPDLFSTADVHVGLPDAFNMQGQDVIALGAGAA